MNTSLPLLAFAFASQMSASAHELVKIWETPAVFPSCESVRFDPVGRVLYVSNLGPSQSPGAKDGDGSIGKVALDGRVIEADWIKGLNGPKGLGLHAGKLYVADIDRVVAIDVARGAIDRTIAIDGAGSLNDLTIDDAGTVYVSDHRTGRVIALRDGVPSVFIAGVANLNGLLSHGKDFYILARGVVYRAQPDGGTVAIVTDLDASVDGIEHVADDTFIVSCSKGVIYAVNVATGAKQTLVDHREAGIRSADIGIDIENDVVYVPTLFTHTVIAYRLK